ncbi:hypothetical protein A2U01_0113945, partial [Trifolium medium]|nr:hypothetical protein [Trifolium medium]
MSRECIEWHPAIYINQMKNLHQKVSRLSSQINYKVVYEDASTVVYS